MFKKIDGINVEYEYKKVSEKTIVFLHGFSGNLNNFSYFAKVFNNFNYSTLNINLTDFGFKNLPKFFNIYSFSEVVYKLIKSFGINKFSLVGHSFGGRISIVLSSMYKGVDKVVLVDSAGIKPRFSLKTKCKIIEYKLTKFLLNKKILKKSNLDKFGSSDYKNLSNNLKCVFQNVIKEDLSFLLKNIKSKTLIVFGEKDRDTPIYMAKKLHANIEKSKLIILKNAGHYSYLDKREKFISIVKNFLGEYE